MRFLTNQADGMLFYADSNQGDHFILELLRGRLYFHIDLGKICVPGFLHICFACVFSWVRCVCQFTLGSFLAHLLGIKKKAQ